MKNTRSEPMKPVVKKNCIGLDRLATWKELRCAMEFSSQGAFELDGTGDVYRDVRSDFSACVGVLPEELEWVALASEMQDRKSN